MTLAQLLPILQLIFPDNEIVEAAKEGRNFKILFSGLNFYWQVEPSSDGSIFIVKNKQVLVGIYKPDGTRIS